MGQPNIDDAAFADALAAGDAYRMVELYLAAASDTSPAAEAFYLTQAYVIALEAGAPTELVLTRLRALGAEP